MVLTRAEAQENTTVATNLWESKEVISATQKMVKQMALLKSGKKVGAKDKAIIVDEDLVGIG